MSGNTQDKDSWIDEWRKRYGVGTSEDTTTRSQTGSSTKSTSEETSEANSWISAWRNRYGITATSTSGGREKYDYNQGVDDYNNFMTEFGKWYDMSRSGMEDVTWADAAETSRTKNQAASIWMNRAGELRRWANDNKDILGDDYQAVMDSLQQATTATYWLDKGYKNTTDYFSQWDTQQDYDQYVADREHQEEMVNFNIPGAMSDMYTAWKDLEDARSAYNDLYELEGPYGLLANDAVPEDERQRNQARYDEIVSKYGEGITAEALYEQVRQMEDAYSQMQSQVDEATQYQAGGQTGSSSPLDESKPKTAADYRAELDELNSSIEAMANYIDVLNARYAELDTAIANYSSSSDPESYGKLATAQSELNTVLTQLNQAQQDYDSMMTQKWQLEQDSRFKTIRESADYDQYTGYVVNQQDESGNVTSRPVDDQLYRYINSRGGTAFPFVREDHKQEDLDWIEKNVAKYSKFANMTDDEIADLNYIYRTQGQKAASDYITYLSPILDAREMQSLAGDFSEMASQGLGGAIVANVLSVPLMMSGGLGTLDILAQNAAKKLTGSYQPINYNSTNLIPTVAAQAVRKTTAANITDRFGTIQLDENEHPILAPLLNGRGLADVYQWGMSAVDSKVAGLTGNPAVATALLASSAATQGVLDALERGATDEQALTLGLWNGAFEAIFEFWEIDNLLKGNPNAIKNMVNQAITEGVGEGATTLANNIADAIIMADKSAINQKIAEYIEAGMDPEAAKKKALGEAVIDMMWDAIGGAVSGGISAGGMSMVNAVSQKSQYNRLPGEVKSSADRLQNYGNDRDTALRISALLYEQGEEYGDSTGAYMAAYDPKQDAYAYAADFRKAYEIGRNNGNQEYLGKLSLNEAQQKIAYELGAAESRKASQDTKAPEVKEEELAYSVSDDGATIDSTGKKVTVKGFSSVGSKVTLELEGGKTIDAKEVSFGTADDAILYETIGQVTGAASTANHILESYETAAKEGMSASDFAAGLRQAYDLGVSGQVAERQLGTYELAGKLPVAARSAAFSRGRAVGQYNATARRAALEARGRQIQGKREGTFHFDRKGRTFDGRRESSLKAMEAISKALGVDIYVYESYKEGGKRVYQDRSGTTKKAPNGYYDEQGIHIDLNAGNFGQGTMMFTVAHELTHFAKEWSPVKFRKLADLLVERYAEQGTSVRDLIDKQIVKAKENGREIDRDTAFEEVVADSMETMLTRGDLGRMMAELKQQDKTLWEKVRDWFKDLIQKLQAVVEQYKGAKPETAEGQLVAQMEDFIQVLQQAYAEALVEAGENYRANEGKKNTTQEVSVKYSLPYSDAIDLLDREELDRSSNTHLLVLNHTPSLYVNKADAKNLKIVMAWDIAYLAMKKDGPLLGHYHNLGKDVMKRIPSALEDPLYILKQNNGRIVAVTEVVVKKNRSVLVSVELDTFKSTVQNGENLSENYNLIVTVFDAKANYLNNLFENSDVKFNKNNEDPAHFILRLKSLNKALPNDGLAESSGTRLPQTNAGVNPQSTEKLSDRDAGAEKVVQELEKQNAKLKEDVKDLRELLRLQGKLTHGQEFKKSSIDAAVRGLAKEAMVTLDAEDRKQLHEMLKDFYRYIATDKELAWEGVMEKAGQIADFLMDRVNIKPERSAEAQEVLRQIRGAKVRLSDSQRAEVEKLYGYDEFRKMLFGAGVYLSKDGMELDSFWHEQNVDFPWLFAEDVNEGDQPAELLRIIDSMREGDDSMAMEYAFDHEAIRQGLIRAVYDSYWRVDNLKTVADRKQKEINEIRRKHTERMEAMKEEQRQTVRGLKDKRRADIAAVRKEYRERNEKQIERMREQYKESRERAADIRKKADMRSRIRKVIRDLDKLFSRGDKQRNVKEGLKDLAATTIASAEVLFMDGYTENEMIRDGVTVDLSERESRLLNQAMDILTVLDNPPADPEGIEAWYEQEAVLKGKLSRIKQQLKEVFERQRNKMDGTTVKELLQQLANSYAELMQSEESYIRDAFDENVYEHLLTIMDGLGYAKVKDMRLNQMEALYDAYKMVLTTIRNANKLFDESIKETKQELAEKVMIEESLVANRKPKTKAGVTVSKFAWNNLKPVYAFERIGSNTLSRLYGNIRKGQDSWAVDMRDANDFRLDVQKKYGSDSWDMDKVYTFKTNSGADFNLTLEQLMSIYAYSKREQAYDHMMKGGFVFDDNTTTTVTKLGIPVEMMNEDASTYKVSMDTLSKIIGALTQDQAKFVDEMQEYLSATMGDKGNSVSMKLYGIKLFNEKNYFPLKSASQYMAKAKEADLKKEQGQINIASSGFTKNVAPKASNPIILSGFMDVWAGHVNDMSMYHSFVLPMEDFRRVYNYSTPNEAESASASVNAAIQNAHGKAATAYIDQLYRDLNGGALTDSREGLAKNLVGKFKKGAVMASLSVVFQQPSAIGRAFSMVDLKYFDALAITRGVGRAVFNRKNHDKQWAELKKYAPVAMIKEMGYFDTGMGMTAKEFLQAKEYNGIGEKAKAFFTDSGYWDEMLSKPAAVADELTWVEIWRAVKNETAARNPEMDRTSEEFLKIAGDRFSEVIDKTQVYDSVLARSANMRSKSLFMTMATSFMAESTTTANMVEDALRKGVKGQKKDAARIMASAFVSIVINAALSSIIYAARDDDEDETYLEKYLSRFLTDIIDGVNPLTYIPIIKDMWSIAQGFDVERADMSLVSDLVDAMQKVMQLLNKDTSSMSADALREHRKSIRKAWMSTVDVVANLLGIPLKNARRDVNAAINMFGVLRQDFGGRKTTWGSLGDVLQSDIQDSIPVWGWLNGETKGEKLLDAIIRGDDAYVERLIGSYKDQDAAETAIRKTIKEQYLSGKIDEKTARDYLTRYGGRTINEAYFDMKDWDTGENNGMYYDVYKAALAGDDIGAAVDELVKYGEKTEKEVLSQLKSQIGTWYTDPESKTKIDRAEAKRMLETYFDMDADEIEEQLRLWDMKVDTGFSLNDLKEKFLNESVSAEEAVRFLMEYGGKDREEAQERVDDWAFELEHGYSYDDIRQTYLDEEITAEEARSVMMEVAGKTKEEADRSIKLWDHEKETGWRYEDRATLYKDGKITREQLVDALIDVGDYDRKDAGYQVEVYEWEMDGLEGATINRVEKWHEYCEKAGVSKEQFLKIQKFSADTKNDVDADGDTVRFSAMKKVMAEIDKLPLKASQKDALARSLGWSDKNISKYKPW